MSVLTPIVDTWDGIDRLIYLKQGVEDYYPIEDIYHEYRNQRRLDEELRKYEPLLRAEGNIPKGGGKFTPRYIVLLDGTKIVPYDESLRINQLGEIITDDPDVDDSLYDISTLTVPKIIFIQPSEGEVIEVDVGSGVSEQDKTDIIDGVWDEVLADHTTDGSYGTELATKADIAAASSTTETISLTGSVVYGIQDSGTFASTAIRDNAYWEIEEHVDNGLTAELTFNIPDDDRAGVFRVFGRYEGTPALLHYMELWTYNYEASAWEKLLENFLPGGNTVDEEYEHEYFERNIDRTNNNEVKFRLIHNVTTYSAAHHMYLDLAEVTSIEVITAADIATAVWAEDEAKRVLGLLDENSYLDNQTYDSNDQLLTARKRIYSNSSSVGTANDVIGTYNITATWSGAKITSYKMVII